MAIRLCVLALASMLIITGCGGGAEKKDELPTPAPTTAPSLETSSEQINWVTVTDQDKIYSMSVPSGWETNSDVGELAEQYPQFMESGMLLLLESLSESGASIFVWMDITQLLLEEPQPIDLEAYTQAQVEDIKKSLDPDEPEVRGRVLSEPIETDVISINGIGGVQLRYVINDEVKILFNGLIGDEDDPVTSCGSVVYGVQGTYFVADTSTELNVIEKALESFRVLPTASGGLDSCSDRKELSFLD